MTEANFNIFFWILGVFALGITINNFRNLKNLNRERLFQQIYVDVLKQEEGSTETINNYVAEEKLGYLKNKAMALQIYQMLINGEDPSQVIEEINFNPIFKEKGNFVPKKANRNSDIFIWLLIVFAKAKQLNKEDVVEKLYKKMEAFDEFFENQVEYQLYKSSTALMNNKDGEEIEFLTRLLDGDYSGMVYEKKLIGLYKRFAACVLASKEKEFDEFFRNDLHSFASTLVGRVYMQDLGIYEKYPPIEEKVEVLKEEEKEIETKEEPKE